MILNQTIKIRLIPSNISYWISKGYLGIVFDEIDVLIKDLQPKSNIYIECKCDECGITFKNRYSRRLDKCKSCILRERMKSNTYGKNNRKYEIPSKEELEALIKSGLGKVEISKKYDTTIIVVDGWLTYHRLNIKPYCGLYKEIPSDFKKSYKKNKLSIKEIKQRYNISYSTAKRWLKECGFDSDKPQKTLLFELPLEKLVEQTNFLPSDCKQDERIYCILNNINENLICSLDVCPNRIKFIRGKYRKFCSTKCMANDKNIKAKRIETNLKRFGSVNPMHNKMVKEKICRTNMERYGVNNPQQNKDIKAKLIQTNLERYGVEHAVFLAQSPSKEEVGFINELNTTGFDFVSTRKILKNNYELDGYDESKKIAIEYCGIRWHVERDDDIKMSKNKLYHYNKWKECKDLGITLFTVFSDEYKQNKDKVINMIKSKGGYFDHIIYARKTDIRLLTKEDASSFCKTYHLQNFNPKTHTSFGLFNNDQLVSLMAFGYHHRNTKELVLNRYCSVFNTKIIGGASKLIKYASKYFGMDIVTWSDNRWSNGNVYEKIGFIKQAELKPDYCWVKNDIRYSKQSRRKQATNQPKELTEKEFNESMGFRRLWDCGKIKWKYLNRS